MIQAAALLPIAPFLLLPFILIFFVIVFPFWLIGVVVLWLLKLLVRLVGGGPGGRWSARVQIWFRWVLTFGGFTNSYTSKNAPRPIDVNTIAGNETGPQSGSPPSRRIP
jgi:hypothetical protein